MRQETAENVRRNLVKASVIKRILLSVFFSFSLTGAIAQDGNLFAEFEGTVLPSREADITPIVSAWLDTVLLHKYGEGFMS